MSKVTDRRYWNEKHIHKLRAWPLYNYRKGETPRKYVYARKQDDGSFEFQVEHSFSMGTSTTEARVYDHPRPDLEKSGWIAFNLNKPSCPFEYETPNECAGKYGRRNWKIKMKKREHA